MRVWLYKCNYEEGGPAGYYGDWLSMVFDKYAKTKKPVRWGGHYSTKSPEVANYLSYDLHPGDLIVSYQTDEKAIVGVCEVTSVRDSTKTHNFHGRQGKEMWVKPVKRFRRPLPIHEVKRGTILALPHCAVTSSMVMLRELELPEAALILKLGGVSDKEASTLLNYRPAPVGPRRPRPVDPDKKRDLLLRPRLSFSEAADYAGRDATHRPRDSDGHLYPNRRA
jgi:EVE domain